MTSDLYSVRVSLPEASTASSILLAPTSRSAPETIEADLSVRSPGPIPMPIRDTLRLESLGVGGSILENGNSSSSASLDCTWWKSSPLSSGLSMTTRVAPALFAARTFSLNPPASPESLVTMYLAPVCLSMATFISSENGPWAQMRFLPSNPSAAHFWTDSTVDRTLATTLSV